MRTRSKLRRSLVLVVLAIVAVAGYLLFDGAMDWLRQTMHGR